MTRRLRHAVRADPFTVLEAVLVGVLVVAFVGFFTLAGAVESNGSIETAWFISFTLFLITPFLLIVVLVGHAIHDGWRFVRAEEPLPENVPGLARAAWRAFETAVVAAYFALSGLILLAVLTLPEDPENPEGLFGLVMASLISWLMLTYVPAAVVGVRLVATALYRGSRRVAALAAY